MGHCRWGVATRIQLVSFFDLVKMLIVFFFDVVQCVHFFDDVNLCGAVNMYIFLWRGVAWRGVACAHVYFLCCVQSNGLLSMK